MTLRQQLDVLDRHLATALRAGDPRLWDVLTAVRGPDRRRDRQAFARHAVTAAIRGLAFPKTAALFGRKTRRRGRCPTFNTKTSAARALEHLIERGDGGHWAVHAFRALRALEAAR